MKRYVVIVAGGSGTRFGESIPKQYLELCGKPILLRSVECAQKVVGIENVVLVIPERDFNFWQALCEEHGAKSPRLAAAGATRYHSVLSGLMALGNFDEDDLVAVHDGVRPLATAQLYESGFVAASAYGAAVPVVPVVDSVREMTGDGSRALNRGNLRAVQTPQVFNAQLLLRAYGKGYNDSFTDDASVVEAIGRGIAVFQGEISNIKITYPVDIHVAEFYLNR